MIRSIEDEFCIHLDLATSDAGQIAILSRSGNTWHKMGRQSNLPVNLVRFGRLIYAAPLSARVHLRPRV